MQNLPGIKNLLVWLYKRYSNKILPRYYVFAFDVLVVFFSFFVAYAVRLNLDLSAMDMDNIFRQSLFVTFVYTFHFWAFRSYTGIVRYTGLNEIYRLFKAMGWAFFMIICLVQINQALVLRLPFISGSSVPLIHFLISFFVLMAARIVVKSVFQRIVRADNTIFRKVMIFGAGSAGIITREALLQDYRTNHSVVAFIDDNKSKTGKYIEGSPIMLSAEALTKDFVAKAKPDLLIIAAQQVTEERKRELIVQALELQLEVKTVPPVQNWINGSLSTAQLKRVHLEELMGRRPIVLGIEHVARELQNKVVMITGAAGSIGSELARQVLAYNPKKLILLDQAESGIFDLQFEINNNPDLKQHAHLAEYVIANLKDARRIESVFRQFKPEVIYHAAAYKHVPLMEDNPYEALAINVFGTRTIAELAVKYNSRKFVMVSTDKAVNPTNVMGATKRIAEIIIQGINAPKTKFVTTRFGNVLDSSGSVIPIFRKQIEKGGPLTVTHKEVTRYFMLIPEACTLILEAGTMGQGADIFVFDMGKPVRIYDVARRMIQLSGKVPNQDIMIEEVGLRPGEKLYEELLGDKEKTLPTNHEKIMRAKVYPYPQKEILQHLQDLEKLMQQEGKAEMVEKMKEIVPEFAPTNPNYAAK